MLLAQLVERFLDLLEIARCDQIFAGVLQRAVLELWEALRRVCRMPPSVPSLFADHVPRDPEQPGAVRIARKLPISTPWAADHSSEGFAHRVIGVGRVTELEEAIPEKRVRVALEEATDQVGLYRRGGAAVIVPVSGISPVIIHGLYRPSVTRGRRLAYPGSTRPDRHSPGNLATETAHGSPGYDAGVPSYLRWIASLSAGLTAQLIYVIAAGAAFVGTGNTELAGGVGVLVSFGNAFAGMVPAIAVNSWLLRRYPPEDLLRNAAQPSSDSR